MGDLRVGQPYNYEDRSEIQVECGMPSDSTGRGWFSIRLSRFGYHLGEVQIPDDQLARAFRGGRIENADVELSEETRWTLGLAEFWGVAVTFDRPTTQQWIEDEGIVTTEDDPRTVGTDYELSTAGKSVLQAHVNIEKPGGFDDWRVYSTRARRHNQGRISFTLERRIPR